MSFKLGEYNILPSILIHKLWKIQFWKKVFAIGFPCNTLTALPTRQDGVENHDKTCYKLATQSSSPNICNMKPDGEILREMALMPSKQWS